MSRVHCVDCGTDVAVDPLGQCPAGHLLPANGVRISSAIGSHEPYPDEPVPWVGQVDLEVPEPVTVPERPAQPHAAPGLAPAERDTVPSDLLRELGALGSDEPDPVPTRPTTPAPGAPVQTNGHAPATNGHENNGHAVDGHPAAPPVQAAPAANGNGHAPGAELSEFSALEQAIQSLDGAASHEAAPAAGSAAAPAADDDFGQLFADLEGLGNEEPTEPTAAAPAPAPAASRPPPPPPAPAQPAAGAHDRIPSEPVRAERDDVPEPEPARPALDTMNFTAKGGPGRGGKRRKLFGR